jgi:ABC-type Fe3+-hydroxamate transport system substrate-binding protein
MHVISTSGALSLKWMRQPKPIRIVSLAPSATSILCAIGAKRMLVGVTKWCADVAPVARLPKLGDCWHMNSIDEILQLKPTIVIGSVPYKQETVAKLLEHPLNFVAMNPRAIEDIYADIRLLGGISNHQPQAEREVRRMQFAFAQIRKKFRKNRFRPRVYCEAWPNPRISSPPWVAELVAICGGESIGVAGQKVSDADIAQANPDIIVLAWAAVGAKSDPMQSYKVSDWSTVPAIQNKQVFVIRDELLNTPGPPLVKGAHELHRLLTKYKMT